jgi:hypothetical protein
MDGACSTHGTDHSEDLGVDGKMILDLREIVWEVLDLIHSAQDMD